MKIYRARLRPRKGLTKWQDFTLSDTFTASL